MSPKCTHKCPYKREADGASFEDGRSHKPRHVALKAEKGKEMDFRDSTGNVALLPP